jgi:hypothetical protein
MDSVITIQYVASAANPITLKKEPAMSMDFSETRGPGEPRDSARIEHSALDMFLQLHREIADRQAQLEALKPIVVQAVARSGGRITHGGYELTVRTRIAYEYSHYVAAARAHLISLRRLEEEQGLAVRKRCTEFPIVRRLCQ